MQAGNDTHSSNVGLAAWKNMQHSPPRRKGAVMVELKPREKIESIREAQFSSPALIRGCFCILISLLYARV